MGDFEAFGRDPDNSLVLQAARRIAQERSFSNAAIMRELNAAEIIDLSRQEAERQQQQLAAQFAAQHQEQTEAAEAERRRVSAQHDAEIARLAEEHEAHLADRERESREVTESSARTGLHARIESWSQAYAKNMVIAVQIGLFIAFAIALFSDIFELIHEHPIVGFLLKVILGVIATIHFLDLIGVKIVSRRFDALRNVIRRRHARKLLRRLGSENDNPIGTERQEPKFRV